MLFKKILITLCFFSFLTPFIGLCDISLDNNSVNCDYMPKDEIKGKLVTLRQLKIEYLQEYKATFSEPVRKALGLENDAAVDRLILYSLLLHMRKDRLVYCIFENKTDKIIGGIEIRESGHCGNLGNWINDEYWGGGYHQEALGLIAQQHFSINPKSQFFTAHIRQNNWRSYFSLKKFGFEDFDEEPENISDPNDHTMRFTRQKYENKTWNFVYVNVVQNTPGNNEAYTGLKAGVSRNSAIALATANKFRWIWQ